MACSDCQMLSINGAACHELGCPEEARVRNRPRCFECDELMEQTGRNTLYCPSCDVCPECNCPHADGFAHYEGCEAIEDDEDDDEDF